MKYLTLLLVVLLLLVGCSQKDTGAADAQTPTADSEVLESEDSETQESDSNLPTEVTLEIVAGALDPREISVSAGTETRILVYNRGNNKARVDVYLSTGVASVTVEPDERGVLEITPTKVGKNSIELNGAQLGTLTVQ